MIKSVKRYRIWLIDEDLGFVTDAHEKYDTNGNTYWEFNTYDRGFFYSTLSVKAKDITDYISKLENLYERPIEYNDITPGTFPKTKEYTFYFSPSGIKADVVKAVSKKDALDYITNKLGEIQLLTVSEEERLEELRPALIRKVYKENPEQGRQLAGEDIFVEEKEINKG